MKLKTCAELTFIILGRDLVGAVGSNVSGSRTNENISGLAMVGDVNLFLKGTPPHIRENEVRVTPPDASEEEEEEFEAELEIMIAGPL